MNYRIEKVGRFRKYKPIYSTDEDIQIGSSVKLILKLLISENDANAERLWVTITNIDGSKYTGNIDNDPVYVDLKYKDEITFTKQNIFDISND